MRKNSRQTLSNEQRRQFRDLQEKVGIHFRDERLMLQAFTHSSYVNEHHKKPNEDNERLEFLGDAVLEVTVSHFLYKTYPNMSEGDLTKLRAAIVCEPSLVQFANELHFDELVLIGKGEELTGGRSRPALLADVFEAFVGAIFLDQGLDTVDRLLEQVVFPKVSEGAFSHMMDYKSQLQEFVQRKDLGSISYMIIEEKGPAHNREFVSAVRLNDEALGKGKGKSKKEAEQAAAQQALAKLQAK